MPDYQEWPPTLFATTWKRTICHIVCKVQNCSLPQNIGIQKEPFPFLRWQGYNLHKQTDLQLIIILTFLVPNKGNTLPSFFHSDCKVECNIIIYTTVIIRQQPGDMYPIQTCICSSSLCHFIETYNKYCCKTLLLGCVQSRLSSNVWICNTRKMQLEVQNYLPTLHFRHVLKSISLLATWGTWQVWDHQTQQMIYYFVNYNCNL